MSQGPLTLYLLLWAYIDISKGFHHQGFDLSSQLFGIYHGTYICVFFFVSMAAPQYSLVYVQNVHMEIGVEMIVQYIQFQLLPQLQVVLSTLKTMACCLLLAISMATVLGKSGDLKVYLPFQDFLISNPSYTAAINYLESIFEGEILSVRDQKS